MKTCIFRANAMSCSKSCSYFECTRAAVVGDGVARKHQKPTGACTVLLATSCSQVHTYKPRMHTQACVLQAYFEVGCATSLPAVRAGHHKSPHLALTHIWAMLTGLLSKPQKAASRCTLRALTVFAAAPQQHELLFLVHAQVFPVVLLALRGGHHGMEELDICRHLAGRCCVGPLAAPGP